MANLSSAFVHMFTAPANPITPLHIGGSAGVHPATVIHNVLSGAYSSSGMLKPRYSTAAIDTLTAESRPYVNFRITEPAVMSEWLEDHIQGPFGIIPTVDSSGVITHKSVWLPASSSGMTFTFNGTNLRHHPTWRNTSREMVTALRYNYTQVSKPGGYFLNGEWTYFNPSAADLLKETKITEERQHDRMAQLGRRALEVNVDGLHGSFFAYTEHRGFQARSALDQMSREVFSRYGDGPITGTLQALSSAESVSPGDNVILNLATLPVPSSAPVRGGNRFVQVLTKTQTPDGPDFSFIDLGPNQATTAPTVTLAASTVRPIHSIVATVGNLSGKMAIELAESSSAPAVGSALWQYVQSVSSTGDLEIAQRKSGTYHFVRARNTPIGKLRSAWTVSTATAQTTVLTAPTAISATGTGTQYKQALTWTPGESNYKTQICLDENGATLASSNELAVLLPSDVGAYVAQAEFAAGSTYLVGVRHMDIYGGVSAFDSTTFIASTSVGSAPAMLGLAVLWAKAYVQ